MAVRSKQMKKLNGEDLKHKIPVAFSDLCDALHACATRLIDASLPRADSAELYAVVSVEAAVYAYTLFLIAFCADYKAQAISLSEEEEHIVLTVAVKRRRKEAPAGAYVPFVSGEEYLRFSRYATETDLSLCIFPTEDGFVAHLSFVRFRADRYAASSIDEAIVADMMYAAIREYNGEK